MLKYSYILVCDFKIGGNSMKCIRCQSEIRQGDAFCIKCGEKVNWEQMPVQQIPYQQNMYPQQMNTNYNSYPEKKKTKIKPVLIGLLSFVMVVGLVFLMIGLFAGDKEKTVDKNDSSIASTTNMAVETESVDDTEDKDKEETKKIEHTIMVYMVGSDLETVNKVASCDIQEMMNAKYGDDIKIVLQTGGAKKWWTKGIEGGKVQRFEVKTGEIIELDNLGKKNMTDYKTLSEFISFASKNYKAEKYTLVLWNHGGGIPVGFGKEENYNNQMMSDINIKQALKKSDVEFESIVMDACNMCTLEIAMAVKDYAKYMVAAESITAGVGMDYISWLNYMGKNSDASGSEYCELLVTKYMDSLEGTGEMVSMSAINLSKIEAVYEAYVEYGKSVLEKIKNGDYINYTQARQNCGLYKGTDSVDIVTLATKYKTDKSDELITAVINAVGHTESDFLYGHGLAVYSPHSNISKYSIARAGMEKLGYDKELLAYYDAYVSVGLAYLGEENVTNFGGDWYNEALAYQYVESGTQSGEYPLAIEVVDNNKVVNSNNVNWSTLSSIEVSMFKFVDDKSLIMLGYDYHYERDQYGNILLNVPKNWVYINGCVSSYICVSKYENAETGEWMELGSVFARCNGKDIIIIISFDNDNPKGKIAGYMYFDFESLTETEYGERVFSFKEGDDVELIYPIINGETREATYVNYLGQHFDGGALKISYSPIDMSKEKVSCFYVVYDIYGNSYETEMILFE